MNTAKWIVAFGLLASGPVLAQDTVYDYQGHVMTGFGGPETLTAQMSFFGPLSNPDTLVSIKIDFYGAYSQSFSDAGCIVIGCLAASEDLTWQINERNGKFIGADINFLGLYGKPGSYDEFALDIGPAGDSFNLSVLSADGPTLVSVSNSTPGVWKEVRANRAPELNANGALSAITLLAGCLLISTGKRRNG
jgi:hypothetical protein